MNTVLSSRVSVKAPIATRRARSLVARADESTAVAKVDRSKESLFFPTEQSLEYLDGSRPADFGFDPLGLSDPEGAGGFIDPNWLTYGELINSRWAMLGVVGCVMPEILGGAGVIPQETNILWFKTGVFPPAGTTDVFGIDPYALFWIEIFLMNITELRRWQDYNNPGSMGKQYFLGLENFLGGTGEPAYPGGLFNPAGMAKDPSAESTKVMRTKELRNGRLAMIAMLGFASQACITGKGPMANLADHLSDPFGNNLLTNLGHIRQ